MHRPRTRSLLPHIAALVCNLFAGHASADPTHETETELEPSPVVYPAIRERAPMHDEPPGTAEPRRFDDSPLHVEGRLGFATLVGLAGVTLGYNVHDRLELGAGSGWASGGLALAGYARLRPLVGVRRERLHAMTVELGYSTSPFRLRELDLGMGHSAPEDRTVILSSRAHWLHLDIGWETRAPSGFTLRIAPGVAWMLNPSSLYCEDELGESKPCRSIGGTWLPALTLGVGG